MASTSAMAAMHSSPTIDGESSNDVSPAHVTSPSTAATNFSPEDVRARRGNRDKLPAIGIPPSKDYPTESIHSNGDPFTATNWPSGLSPIAAEFVPGQRTSVTTGSTSGRNDLHHDPTKPRLPVVTHRPSLPSFSQSAWSYGNAAAVGPMAGTPKSTTIGESAVSRSLPLQNHLPSGTPMTPMSSYQGAPSSLTLTPTSFGEMLSDNSPDWQPHFIREPLLEGKQGTFTTDKNEIEARHLLLYLPLGFIADAQVSQIFNNATYPSLLSVDASELQVAGKLLLSFTDIRHAQDAFMRAHTLSPRCTVLRLNPIERVFRGLRYNEKETQWRGKSIFEGQMLATLVSTNNSAHRFDSIVTTVIDLLRQFGDLKAIHYWTWNGFVFLFRCEFYDVHHCCMAMNTAPNNFNGFGLSFRPWSPRELSEELNAHAPTMYSSGSSLQMRSGPYPDGVSRRSNDGSRGTRATSNSSNYNHNAVDIGRIRAGLDVRTTVMLRNIPNRMDIATLKTILDETSLGQFDFAYLRIDFANECNVGYAFINFADPLHIVNFYHRRAGHRWNVYNSDKRAEVSYATIQGRDCLIAKFRNSSVMLEHPSFRPKLFKTGNGPDAGKEEKFPGPDNASKMRRSVENAEHVGLFPPRHGQFHRDQQRRRRSQFDRGTTHAEAEAVREGFMDPTRNNYWRMQPVQSTPFSAIPAL